MNIVIQVIEFRLAGLTEADYRAHAERVAPLFAGMPGLLSKVWLANAETNTYGGVYTWRDRASLEHYRASAVYAGLLSNPGVADVSDRDFGILPEATRVTAPELLSAV
jgi:heme-degrading monooxygenase HmoA